MTTLKAFDGDRLLWSVEIPVPEPQPAPVFFPGFPGRVILLGATGGDVQTWQDRLAHLGFHTDTTGTYDPTTAQATRDFQSAQGLSPTGMVDEATWKAAFHPFAGE